MHVVEKVINGHPYFYLVEKARRGKRVVTSRTIYIGNRRRLAEVIQAGATAALPKSYSSQEVGASLAFAKLAGELGIEDLIDKVCPLRAGAVPLGRRFVLAAIQRVLAPRWANGKSGLAQFHQGRALVDLLPASVASLDHRRICKAFSRLSPTQVELIESAIVQRVVAHEQIELKALAFDCTNFDSYAGAATPSRLLKMGHGKSGRHLRALGMGLLVSDDGGIPLLTFSYPGNENDVTAFGRFLKALDRRAASLAVPVDATIAADGGNISKAILRRLEGNGKQTRHYVLRLPARHANSLLRVASTDLPILDGFKDKVRAQKHECAVYGVNRCVVDMYSPRMHRRQLPGLLRDRKKARADLAHLQRQLDLQRQGQRHAKPITVAALKRRVAKALSREHMQNLFSTQVASGDQAPTLSFQELETEWRRLETHVLGRTLLVTSRLEWPTERIVRASRKQSHNERFFRDIKDPAGASMLPLRHRRDRILRANALVVALGLTLARLLLRRLKKAGVGVRSVRKMVQALKRIRRGRMHLHEAAPPALRAIAAATWIPSEHTPLQREILSALALANCQDLGTTLFQSKKRSRKAAPRKRAA